ncbi:hypothetical protein L226DRAFT_520246 [Lentinus tigrinus ALCF2SS1-7]|uniref:Uncharacterized protein n=1 Tax=Lentinus tigrinus ALCF2SS1-6 TaxID=1328759 RepID=A0A5C2SPS2_9APHY|nr:hypothetical protein L227DRAFT_560139 [Lentinus tigrinus ALCF2SS1-6]RPD79255.1 hypothetical protein L226DRAFT_520246 [Lentinus tigrinus ALCF2SS1-7]
MPTLTILTSHYSEKIRLSLCEIIHQEDQNTRVTLVAEESQMYNGANPSGTRRLSPRRTTSPSTASASSPQLLSSPFVCVSGLRSVQVGLMIAKSHSVLSTESEYYGRLERKSQESLHWHLKKKSGKSRVAVHIMREDHG